MSPILYSCDVNSTSATYRFLTKSFAVLLMAGFLLPSGLHGKQLVDFCMMEMNSHQMADSSHAHHDSPETEKQASHGHQDCDWGVICACSVDKAPLSDENSVPVSSSSAITLQADDFDHTFFLSDEPIRHELQARIGQHDPPLYLLYDTFLN